LEEEKMSGREEKLFYALQRLSEPYIEAYDDYGEVDELHSKPLTLAEALDVVQELVDPHHQSKHDLQEMIKLAVAHFGEGTELPYCANDDGDFKVKYRLVSLDNFYEDEN
jgi:hypothetical protein